MSRVEGGSSHKKRVRGATVGALGLILAGCANSGEVTGTVTATPTTSSASSSETLTPTVQPTPDTDPTSTSPNTVFDGDEAIRKGLQQATAGDKLDLKRVLIGQITPNPINNDMIVTIDTLNSDKSDADISAIDPDAACVKDAFIKANLLSVAHWGSWDVNRRLDDAVVQVTSPMKGGLNSSVIVNFETVRLGKKQTNCNKKPPQVKPL